MSGKELTKQLTRAVMLGEIASDTLSENKNPNSCTLQLERSATIDGGLPPPLFFIVGSSSQANLLVAHTDNAITVPASTTGDWESGGTPTVLKFSASGYGRDYSPRSLALHCRLHLRFLHSSFPYLQCPAIQSAHPLRRNNHNLIGAVLGRNIPFQISPS